MCSHFMTRFATKPRNGLATAMSCYHRAQAHLSPHFKSKADVSNVWAGIGHLGISLLLLRPKQFSNKSVLFVNPWPLPKQSAINHISVMKIRFWHSPWHPCCYLKTNTQCLRPNRTTQNCVTKFQNYVCNGPRICYNKMGMPAAKHTKPINNTNDVTFVFGAMSAAKPPFLQNPNIHS